jgi:hypothetical protein
MLPDDESEEGYDLAGTWRDTVQVTPDETDAEVREPPEWYRQGMYRRITGKSF